MDVETKKDAPLEAEVPNSNKTLATFMDVETSLIGESESASKPKSPSVLCYLKRVMDLEKEEIKGSLGLLVLAVHAVFLESGFVVCDGDGLRLPRDCNLASTAAVSIKYTVPELLGGGENEARDVKVASLKLSPMGSHVLIYGSLVGEPGIYRLHSDLKTPDLLVFLCDDAASGEEEEEVLRFWKTVKDGLCQALLIDICEKNGLPLPPCFASLPTDVKRKVLELLPGDDVAKSGCTCSEMNYLANSDDELWKHKYVEEFKRPWNWESDDEAESSWKDKFKRRWIRRRDVRRDYRENPHRYPRGLRPGYRLRGRKRYLGGY